MTKQYSGSFPKILRRRLKGRVLAEEEEAVFKALVEHYRLSNERQVMLQKVK
jgi:hypothetical protein